VVRDDLWKPKLFKKGKLHVGSLVRDARWKQQFVTVTVCLIEMENDHDHHLRPQPFIVTLIPSPHHLKSLSRWILISTRGHVNYIAPTASFRHHLQIVAINAAAAAASPPPVVPSTMGAITAAAQGPVPSAWPAPIRHAPRACSLRSSLPSPTQAGHTQCCARSHTSACRRLTPAGPASPAHAAVRLPGQGCAQVQGRTGAAAPAHRLAPSRTAAAPAAAAGPRQGWCALGRGCVQRARGTEAPGPARSPGLWRAMHHCKPTMLRHHSLLHVGQAPAYSSTPSGLFVSSCRSSACLMACVPV